MPRRRISSSVVSQLHVSELVTRIVARPLEITALLSLFDTYLTLSDALATLAG